MEKAKDSTMETLSAGWKALADGVYNGFFTVATVTIARDRITIEAFNYDDEIKPATDLMSGVATSFSHVGEGVAPMTGEIRNSDNDGMVAHGPKFIFQIGSMVILETSRAELEAQRQAEREWEKAKASEKPGQTTQLLRSARAYKIEAGIVIARAEHETLNQYLVRYSDATGVGRESWWEETALFQDDEEFAEVR